MGTYGSGSSGLAQAVRDLSMAKSIEEIQDIVRRAARALTGADGATFVLRDGDTCHYVDEDAIGPLWKGQRFPIETCISGAAMVGRRPIAIPDISVDPRIPIDAYRPTFVTSLAMVPIRSEQPIGAIGNYWASSHEATEEEVALLQALADSTSVALENVAVRNELEERVRLRTAQLEEANELLMVEVAERRRAEDEVRRLSLTDDLTGVFNRRGFLLLAGQECAQLHQSGVSALLLFVDIDGLKQTNDRFGHDAGDRLIARVAGVLSSATRGAGVVGRLGGDEFAVFLPLGPASPTPERIVEEIEVAAAVLDARLSVGVTRVSGADATSIDELLVRADSDMYRVRRTRRRDRPVVAGDQRP